MTFYERELRKIIGGKYPDATYVGRACYVRLSDTNRAKIQFVTGITETLIGVLEFDPKDIEKAGYGYLIEEYFAEEEE